MLCNGQNGLGSVRSLQGIGHYGRGEVMTFPYNSWDAISLDSGVSLSQGGSEREKGGGGGQRRRGSRGL